MAVECNHDNRVKHCSSPSFLSHLTSPHLTPFTNIYCNCSALLTSQGQSKILLRLEFIKDSKMIKTQFFNLSVSPPWSNFYFCNFTLDLAGVSKTALRRCQNLAQQCKQETKGFPLRLIRKLHLPRACLISVVLRVPLRFHLFKEELEFVFEVFKTRVIFAVSA